MYCFVLLRMRPCHVIKPIVRLWIIGERMLGVTRSNELFRENNWYQT